MNATIAVMIPEFKGLPVNNGDGKLDLKYVQFLMYRIQWDRMNTNKFWDRQPDYYWKLKLNAKLNGLRKLIKHEKSPWS